MIFLCSRCFIFGTYFQWLVLNYNSLWPSADGANDCVCWYNLETNNTLPRLAFFFASSSFCRTSKRWQVNMREPHFFVLQIHSSMHSHYWEHARHKIWCFRLFRIYRYICGKGSNWRCTNASTLLSHQPGTLKCLQVNDQMPFSLLRTE